MQVSNVVSKMAYLVAKSSLCLMRTGHTFLCFQLCSAQMILATCQGYESQVFSECGHYFRAFSLMKTRCLHYGEVSSGAVSFPLLLVLSFLAHALIHLQSASANERMCHGNRNNVIRSAREVESALW